jgi:predicted nuclease with TOPRIM domain
MKDGAEARRESEKLKSLLREFDKYRGALMEKDALCETIEKLEKQLAAAQAKIAELEKEMNELRRCGDGLREYVMWYGGMHDFDCPEDDTCECSDRWINDAVNKLCCHLLPPADEGE